VCNFFSSPSLFSPQPHSLSHPYSHSFTRLLSHSLTLTLIRPSWFPLSLFLSLFLSPSFSLLHETTTDLDLSQVQTTHLFTGSTLVRQQHSTRPDHQQLFDKHTCPLLQSTLTYFLLLPLCVSQRVATRRNRQPSDRGNFRKPCPPSFAFSQMQPTLLALDSRAAGAKIGVSCRVSSSGARLTNKCAKSIR